MLRAVARVSVLLIASLGAFGSGPLHASVGQGARPMAYAAPVEDPDGARVIVKFKPLGGLMRSLRAGAARPLGPQFAALMSSRHGLALRDGRIVEGRTQVLRGDASISSAQLAARLAADSEVEYAVPDYRRFIMAAPNDPLFAASSSISPAAGQWYLRAPDSTFVSAIDAPAAWRVTTGSPAIVVADIDTGVRFDHPDLANKLHAGYDFVSSATSAADSSGRDGDASDPGDAASVGECGFGSAATASSWHGTKTAGLIGALTDNAVGMASIGRDVMVLPARALGKCGGSDSDIIAAMLWAGGVSNNPSVNPNPARVINLSLGGSGSCTAAYADAIGQLSAAGVVVVAAAGNSQGQAVSTPGNCAGVISVAALRHAGTKVGFSSVGPEVAIAAPGGNCVNLSGACLYPILTTTDVGTTTPTASGYTNSSSYSVGTSFATPLVAGTAALMLSANPALTPAQVRSLIRSTARAFPASSSDPTLGSCHAPNSAVQDECLCTTSTCGAGMLDAGAAVAAAAAITAPLVQIQASADVVAAGSVVSFDASASSVSGGLTIRSYQWSIVSGASIARFTSATDAATATVATDGAGSGSFVVRLALTDSLGQTSSADHTVAVTGSGASGGSSTGATASGGGGGGAAGGWWLVALAAAAWALGRRA